MFSYSICNSYCSSDTLDNILAQLLRFSICIKFAFILCIYHHPPGDCESTGKIWSTLSTNLTPFHLNPQHKLTILCVHKLSNRIIGAWKRKNRVKRDRGKCISESNKRFSNGVMTRAEEWRDNEWWWWWLECE